VVIFLLAVFVAFICCNRGSTDSDERWYHCYWCAEQGCCQSCNFEEQEETK
jgi:hypothetical protein